MGGKNHFWGIFNNNSDTWPCIIVVQHYARVLRFIWPLRVSSGMIQSVTVAVEFSLVQHSLRTYLNPPFLHCRRHNNGYLFWGGCWSLIFRYTTSSFALMVKASFERLSSSRYIIDFKLIIRSKRKIINVI